MSLQRSSTLYVRLDNRFAAETGGDKREGFMKLSRIAENWVLMLVLNVGAILAVPFL